MNAQLRISDDEILRAYIDTQREAFREDPDSAAAALESITDAAEACLLEGKGTPGLVIVMASMFVIYASPEQMARFMHLTCEVDMVRRVMLNCREIARQEATERN